MRRLTVLSVAYPLATVGPDAVGGAEQILSRLDRALVAAGHVSLVVARESSSAAGTLLPVPRLAAPFDADCRKAAEANHRAAIVEALRSRPIDLIHFHGVDFTAYLPASSPPALATLHLPPEWYPPAIFRQKRGRLWLHCVSQTQHRRCPPSPALLPPIGNGVEVGPEPPRRTKHGFALALGRLCPEKGFHLALDAAHAADCPLLLAGEVYPYPEHEAYFHAEILPRLDARRRFLGPVAGARKRRLLSGARCLLAPSLAPETSSLVAMEALAVGTPVIAFPVGALPEIIEEGRTGFLVEDVPSMAGAIRHAGEIDPALCHATARRRFSAERMTARYLARYRALARLCAVASRSGTRFTRQLR